MDWEAPPASFTSTTGVFRLTDSATVSTVPLPPASTSNTFGMPMSADSCRSSSVRNLISPPKAEPFLSLSMNKKWVWFGSSPASMFELRRIFFHRAWSFPPGFPGS